MATHARLSGDRTSAAAILILQLAALAGALAELRQAQQRTTQAEPPSPPPSDSTPSARHPHGNQPRPAPAPPPTSPRKLSPAHLYRTAARGPHQASASRTRPLVPPAGRHGPGHADQPGNFGRAP
jgi:hypothetical protein